MLRHQVRMCVTADADLDIGMDSSPRTIKYLFLCRTLFNWAFLKVNADVICIISNMP